MTETEKTAATSAHLLGGFVGGLSSAITLQPLDLLKTRIQQNKNTTLLSALRQIDNPLHLWRGTFASAMRTSVGSALYLSCLNTMRTSLAANRGVLRQSTKSSNLPQLTIYENLAAGAVARGMVGYATMPFTVLKVRYESTFYHYTSICEATRDIYRTQGIKGFFRGFGPTCLRDAPYSGIYVLLYEKAKVIMPLILPRSFITQEQNGRFTFYTSAIVNALSAIFSASLATSITAPFDTIKTRMQLESAKFTSFFPTLSMIITQEGSIKLFSGLSMRLTRKALSAGIAWGIYEELIKRFM
ncbi:ZYBA0S04-05754g1_1 [Zygosaccharomyces bailii CLIB 213]|uniref:Mitochondrial glycine transporter n=1 Tax=Zygosaccharomyces bailii (strain CLIB 213 / ATCC 58445 / CBS 680 / BCRC 21525 / NBRC 1098 / NCYC 1416 / NRRL Y-2227) TaxID=1333698 RepID=A0A8J2T6E2_ZYGB2|nr:ZYBA0S04-05754g1_1 [Zygosaccharomyces bailii CLIB 213]